MSSVAERVLRTGRAARTDTFADCSDPGNACRRALGIHAAVAVPIVVENRLWGTIAVTSAQPERMPQVLTELCAVGHPALVRELTLCLPSGKAGIKYASAEGNCCTS